MRERDWIDLVPPPRVGVISRCDSEQENTGNKNDAPQHEGLEGDTT
jgi:hypothetical protein